MRRIGTIVVAKSTKLTPIAMTILTGKNDDPLEKWLSDSADKIKSVLSMPGILSSEDSLSNFGSQSAGIESSLNDSIKYLTIIFGCCFANFDPRLPFPSGFEAIQCRKIPKKELS